ncbi:MAG: hypothetical protein H6Q02_1277, partial [Acidobacteria bacterium]|nr:hypothetical protein [Acidobacteriota bacterium]
MKSIASWGLLASILSIPAAAAAESETVLRRGAEVVGEAVTPSFVDVDLRDLPRTPGWKPGDPIKEIPRRFRPGWKPAAIEPPTGPDPLLERASRLPEIPTTLEEVLNFAGQGFTGVNPPDTVGDVGVGYYIQTINTSGGTTVRIHDKTDGSVVAGPFILDSLGTGSCASGLGDPVALYDEAADRWLLSEFASSGNRLCVYISQTSDPVAGGWCAYQFTASGFPDYPKYGVWPDAYYVTTNESSPAVYAFDRQNMITCGTARASQRFTAPDLSGFPFQALTPADLDGPTLPPAGTPGLMMRHRDTEVHGPAGLPTIDQLEMFAFHVDFNTPANSTFTQLPTIETAEFDSTLCGLSSFSCMGMPGVPQGSGSSLDPLREVVMFRLAYRSFGAHQTLVGNFVTDIGADRGGKRWFELRNAGAGWSLFQEGTHAPDNVNRWMGAIAMDEAGNILLGYNVSDPTSVFPGLRYAGRLASDPAGALGVEATLVAGSAVNGSNRYGDYSAMSIDPEDGCTFWFTGEYNVASSWSTRIGALRFQECGTPDFTLGVLPASQAICAGTDAVYAVAVGSVSGFGNPATLSAAGNPAGTTTGFAPNPVTPPGSSIFTVGNTGGAAAGTYALTVSGSASGSGGHSAPAELIIHSGNPAAATLTAPANGATNVPVRPAFTWTAAAGAADYLLEVDDSPGFSSPVYTASVTATSHTPNADLPSNSLLYWRVTANNPCGSTVSPVFSFTTEALPGDCGIGSVASVEYEYGFEAGANGWTSSGTGNTWAQSSARVHSGSFSWKADGSANVSDQRLVSPPVVLPTGQSPLTLQFWNHQTLEPNGAAACYDGGILEISTDGGATFTQVPTADLLTDPYDGPVSNCCSNPLQNLQAWCGDPQDWLNSVADLDAYAG